MYKEESDWDINLPDGLGDHEYLTRLTDVLEDLLIKVHPDIIFYQAGVDVLQSDLLGKLNLTMQGVRNRDFYVIEACKSHDIPVVITLGGGYSPNIRDIINAHVNTYKAASAFFDI